MPLALADVADSVLPGERGCYLIHFSRPIGSARHTAGHYLGYADDLHRRLDEHRRGRGSHITRAAVKQKRELVVVRLWLGSTRDDERRLKHGHHPEHKRLCPVCRPAHLAARAARAASNYASRQSALSLGLAVRSRDRNDEIRQPAS